MMERCKTCKHWGEIDDNYRYGGLEGVRVCRAIPMFWESTEWKDDGEGRIFKGGLTATAFAQDGSDYSASLYTLATHGCTMHEQNGE